MRIILYFILGFIFGAIANSYFYKIRLFFDWMKIFFIIYFYIKPLEAYRIYVVKKNGWKKISNDYWVNSNNEKCTLYKAYKTSKSK